MKIIQFFLFIRPFFRFHLSLSLVHFFFFFFERTCSVNLREQRILNIIYHNFGAHNHLHFFSSLLSSLQFETFICVTNTKTCVKYCLQLRWFVHLGFWVSYTRHQTVPLNYIFFLVWVIKSDGVWNSMVRKTFAVTFTVASLNLFTICIAYEISISSFFSSLFRIVNIKWQMQSENAL